MKRLANNINKLIPALRNDKRNDSLIQDERENDVLRYDWFKKREKNKELKSLFLN